MNENMIVTIELLGMQRTMAGANSIEVSITARSRVDDVLEYVKENYPQIKLDEEVLVTVNQEIAPRDRVLKPDDIISFLPFISGG